MHDICIIGGGPSGMSAAIAAKKQNPDLRVCILEKNPVLGKKIYATGNGKCNLSNIKCVDPIPVYKFFDSIGIFTRTDEAGRMYPGSEQAADVVEALQKALQSAGVEVICNVSVESVSKNGEGFEIRWKNGTASSKSVLLATGGKAGPQYGNLGEGYAIARTFGHRTNRIYPVLSPLACEGDFEPLKGIRAKGRVTLLLEEKPLASEDGEIQFTEDGLSGICVFNLSRFVRLNPNLPLHKAFAKYAVCIDFLPNLTQQDVEDYLTKRGSATSCDAGRLLLTVVHAGITRDILKRTSVSPEIPVSALTQDEMKQIAACLKNWRCGIIGVKGWKKAQCTGGGIPLEEIDRDSCRSKLTKGLYLAGELLDYDGPSGGYNLHFAWDSGIRAGKAMADEQI